MTPDLFNDMPEECLCELTAPDSGTVNSGHVLNDVWFSTYIGAKMFVIEAISSLTGCNAATSNSCPPCSVNNFGGWELDTSLFASQATDMVAVTISTGGAYLVSLARDATIIVVGPVMDNAGNVLHTPDAWFVPATNRFFDAGDNFGASFEYIDDGKVYFLANNGPVYSMSIPAIVAMIEDPSFHTLPCKIAYGTAQSSQQTCRHNGAFTPTVTLDGPVMDTLTPTSNNDGLNCPVANDAILRVTPSSPPMSPSPPLSPPMPPAPPSAPGRRPPGRGASSP